MNYEGQLSGHRGWVTALACPSQGDSAIKLVSTSRDGTAIAWVENPKRRDASAEYAVPLRRLEGHSDFVSAVSLAHTGNYAITASWDRSFRLWDLTDGQCKRKFIKHTNDVLAVAMSPEDRQIVSGGRDNVIRLWNVQGECVQEFRTDGHTDWVSALAFSPSTEKPVVVSGSWDNTVKVWDVATGKCIHTKAESKSYITTVAVSPDSSLFTAGGKDGIVRLWDIEKGDSLFEINVGHPINQISFCPSRYWICVANEKDIRVYDLETQEAVAELTASTETKSPECISIAWSADGSVVYSGHTDGVIRAWSANA